MNNIAKPTTFKITIDHDAASLNDVNNFCEYLFNHVPGVKISMNDVDHVDTINSLSFDVTVDSEKLNFDNPVK